MGHDTLMISQKEEFSFFSLVIKSCELRLLTD